MSRNPADGSQMVALSGRWDGAKGRCWKRVGARLGQPSVQWKAWPRPEGWCYVDAELLSVTGVAEVGMIGLTVALDILQGSGFSACQGVVHTPSSREFLRDAEPGGRDMMAPGWVFTFKL